MFSGGLWPAFKFCSQVSVFLFSYKQFDYFFSGNDQKGSAGKIDQKPNTLAPKLHFADNIFKTRVIRL